MDRKDIKRGSEKMKLEREEESSAKQPKLLGPQGAMGVEGKDSLHTSRLEDPSGDYTTDYTAKMMDTSEIVTEETDEDDDFEDLSSECPERPGSETNMENEEEESSVKQVNSQGGEEDFDPIDPTMSDNWMYVKWQNSASSLWVVTKSPYSCDWIKNVLKSHIFNEYKSDEKAKKFEIDVNEKFKNRVSSCSCVMFCFENGQWDSASLQEVEDLSSSYGLRNVIILLSEKAPDHRPPGQINREHSFIVQHFSEHQIAWYEDNLEFYNRKIEKMKTMIKGCAPWQGHKVGIFSRSSESEYEWLKMKLESEYFRDAVGNVQSYYISNRGFQQFMTNVSECSFGILYHTKNRGRINITDVTDSLYDEELDYMSQMMNKNVIVVVDDLNNSDDGEKSRILSGQPSIRAKALDLFLFTTEEKKQIKPLMEMRTFIDGETKETIKENK